MSLKDELAQHLKNKDYPAAIDALNRSTLPADEKQRRIARLIERMKAEAKPDTAPAPVKVKAQGKREVSPAGYIVRLFLFAIVVVPVVFLIGHAVNSYMNRYQWRMEDVCRDVYRDDWLADKITFNQWFAGCKAAAAQSIDFYGEQVAYCYNSQNGTDRMFKQCLVDEDVTIYRSKIDETAP